MRFVILFLLFAVSKPGFAQSPRSIDIALKVVSPVSGSTYTPGVPFNFTLQAKNVSGATLDPSDTIKVKLLYDGAIVPFASPNGALDTFLRIGGNQIVVGDSMIIISQQIGINDSGMHTLCFQSSLTTSLSNGIADPATINNTSCTRVNLSSLGISSLDQESADFEIYPQPTRDFLKWKSKTFKPVTFSAYGVNGLSTNYLTYDESRQELNVSTLPSGIYLLVATDKMGIKACRRFLVE